MTAWRLHRLMASNLLCLGAVVAIESRLAWAGAWMLWAGIALVLWDDIVPAMRRARARIRGLLF